MSHTSSKKRVFSGIQPTGNIHLGNYLGAVRHWVDSQEQYENIFCVVNSHAITIRQDPQELQNKTYELAGILLACFTPYVDGTATAEAVTSAINSIIA